MAGETVDLASAEAERSGSGRERSTIEFPYGDMGDALAVVDAIHEKAGTECETIQLAAFMDQSATSGAFRLKLQAARMTGFVEIDRNRVRLTQLGRDAADPGKRNGARAHGFLNVPLYGAIYDKYKGHQLPPAAALEREMVNLGVAKKQTPKARQAFERSAAQAGFFQTGKDRLVAPIHRSDGAPPEKVKEPDRPSGGGGGEGGGQHLLIRGLITRLPEPDTEWPVEERARWLEAASNIFSLLYHGDGGRVDVTYRGKGE